jgi:hypothetical protein
MALVFRNPTSSVAPGPIQCALRMSQVLIVVLGVFGAAVSAQRQTATTVRSIEIDARGDASVVTIAGNGSLPTPAIGVVDGPPRIFLDFPGVRPGRIAIPASQQPRIKRVRMALNNANPLITRVVIDLFEPQPYSVEETSGRLAIIVGASASVSPASAALSPVPPLPEPGGPLTAMNSAGARGSRASRARPPAAPADSPPPVTPLPPAPSRPPSAPSGNPPPARDLERYRRQASAPLDRLLMQQPLLTTLDSSEDQTEERMKMGVEEFVRLRQELAAIKPPETVRAQHEMLLQASTLGLMAMRVRLESLRTNDPNAIKNAASAAAGAIILLERACADLAIPLKGPQAP